MSDDDKFEDQTLVRSISAQNPLELEHTPSLLMISGAQLGRSFPLIRDEFLIGRALTCDLPIEDDLVSRHHCKIIKKPTGVELIDLKSTNGTLVNGKRIEGTRLLAEGDQIQVGTSTILKFAMQAEVEANFFGQLFDAATRDFLTNTYNKKFFIERLRDEFSFAQRHQRNLSILVIDIDHFKKVNDTHGHLAGDIALKKVAHHLLTHTRKDDVVSRFGGEEFVVLMRDVSIEQARHLAEQLRNGISEIEMKGDKQSFKVTVSVGVANLNAENSSQFARFESLIASADEKLYEAKNSGRNRVCS
ncbi:MAG: diguanylate cyclase [Bdellovibrionota bacterium]